MTGVRGDGGRRTALPAAAGTVGAKQVAAVVAVGAAAVSLVATLGAYLYVRFTQHRRGGPGGTGARAGGPPARRDGLES